MNLNKDVSSWAVVKPESVATMSEAAQRNILVMALEDIQRLGRMLESEIDARNKCMAALRGKDQAMDVLFARLRKAGVDYSDLIP